MGDNFDGFFGDDRAEQEWAEQQEADAEAQHQASLNAEGEAAQADAEVDWQAKVYSLVKHEFDVDPEHSPMRDTIFARLWRLIAKYGGDAKVKEVIAKEGLTRQRAGV